MSNMQNSAFAYFSIHVLAWHAIWGPDQCRMLALRCTHTLPQKLQGLSQSETRAGGRQRPAALAQHAQGAGSGLSTYGCHGI